MSHYTLARACPVQPPQRQPQPPDAGAWVWALRKEVDSANTQMFLKVPNIKGDATDVLHQDQIPVESFSWGVNIANDPARVSPRDLHVLIPVSQASPLLFADAGNATLLGQVTLAVAAGATSGESALLQDFLTFKLHNVLISSYQDSLTGEEVSFAFAQGLPERQKSTLNESYRAMADSGFGAWVSSGDLVLAKGPPVGVGNRWETSFWKGLLGSGLTWPSR